MYMVSWFVCFCNLVWVDCLKCPVPATHSCNLKHLPANMTWQKAINLILRVHVVNQKHTSCLGYQLLFMAFGNHGKEPKDILKLQ